MARKKVAVEDVLIAIREKCMDCSGRDRNAVEQCRIENCALYPYRNVKAMTEDEPLDNQISMFEEMIK